MHISEGVLSVPVLASGIALTAAGVTIGLKKMKDQDIPKIAVVSSALFIASLIHIPLGPTSVHLILNGVGGILLGWQIFPSYLLILLLQAILLQYGGLTVLGVNTIIFALPGLISWLLFKTTAGKSEKLDGIMAFICGSLAVLLSGILLAFSLMLTGESWLEVAKLALLAHLPVMVIEGIVSYFCLLFIKKVKPELLGGM